MNKKIFVDSDAFVALAKEDDSNHESAVNLLQKFIQESITFFTSNYVFSECVTIISMKIGHEQAVKFIDTMRSSKGKLVIERIDDKVEEMAVSIFKEQHSKNTSFVDCANIAIVKKMNADAIFSFDGVYKQNGIVMIEDLR